MTEENEQGALDAAEVADTADAGAAPSPEDQAVKRGWKPLDEFAGPKEKWVSAEDFLKRGEDEPALLKANLKRLEAKLEQQAKTITEFSAYAKKADERAYKRALADLEARQEEAVAANDVAEVRKITKEMTELATEVKAGVSTGDPVAAFKERNPWFTDPTKEKMQAWAEGMSSKLAGRGLDAEQQLREIERLAKTEFPEAFENDRRNTPAAVEGKTTPRRATKSYDALPADARAMCDRFVKSGLVTREQYVKDYQWG